MPTKPSPFMFTDREWQQVRAALLFWAAVAENSNTHPSRHPVTEPILAKYGPLETDEITLMLERAPADLYYSRAEISKLSGLSELTVDLRLQSYRVRPGIVVEGLKLYRGDDVETLIPEVLRGLAHRTV